MLDLGVVYHHHLQNMGSGFGNVAAAYEKNIDTTMATKDYDIIWSGKQPLLPERDTQVDNRWAKMPVPDEEREATKESRKYNRSEKWLRSRVLRKHNVVVTDLLTPSAAASGGSQSNSVEVLGDNVTNLAPAEEQKS